MIENAKSGFYVLKLGKPNDINPLIQIRNFDFELLGMAQQDDKVAIASFFGISKLSPSIFKTIEACDSGHLQFVSL